MKRAIISLIIIVAMIMSISVAAAETYVWTNPGTITNYNTRDITQAIPDTTGPFVFEGSFTVNDVNEPTWIGIRGGPTKSEERLVGFSGADKPGQGGAEIRVRNGGATLGSSGIIATAGKTYNVKIESTDGSNFRVLVDGTQINGPSYIVPTTLVAQITDNNAGERNFIGTLRIEVSGTATPTATPTETPTVTPTPEPTVDPSVDPSVTPTPIPIPPAIYTPPTLEGDALEKARSFYTNEYPYQYPTSGQSYIMGPNGTYSVIDGKNGSTSAPSTHSVFGKVTGSDGAPISGANVVLDKSTQVTNENGGFKFNGVDAGKYDISVSAAGFSGKTQGVDVKGDREINFALDVAELSDSGTASAANETGNMTGNVTATPNAGENVTVPSPTPTQSPGFEAVIAIMALLVAVIAVVCLTRKN